MAADDKAAGAGRPLEEKDAKPPQEHRGRLRAATRHPAETGQGGDAQGAHGSPPAWLVADAPLYIYDPEAGAAPARAYNPGDRVSAETVERYGWQHLTHVPEWASAPPAPATTDEEHS